MKGGFITFEGIDGCGKSTQAQLLAERLISLGWEVVLTREPGGTAIGSTLRSLCLEGRDSLAWETEMLLMAADRAQHVAQVIRPALQRGAFVVCDRYVDSSLAYQGYGAQKPVGDVQAVNAIATQGLAPDLTILLAIPPQQRYERPGKADSIESRAESYHQRVYEGFLQIADQNPRIVTLQVAGQSRANVADVIWQVCIARFPQLNTSL